MQVRNFPGRDFTGKVVRSAGTIDPATRTQRFEVDFPNADNTLLAGMYSQVKLSVFPQEPPLLIPASAMLFQTDGTRVAVVEDGKIKMRPIIIGRDLGTDVEVVEGLKGTEQIVTNPGERLAENVEVQVIATSPKPDVAPVPVKTAQR
jgi:RND family efflux transporter MFP subunit